MPHENEYNDEMVAMLELVWGEGFMAPGGAGNVAKTVEGLDLENRRVLDIGCGLGVALMFYAVLAWNERWPNTNKQTLNSHAHVSLPLQS